MLGFQGRNIFSPEVKLLNLHLILGKSPVQQENTPDLNRMHHARADEVPEIMRRRLDTDANTKGRAQFSDVREATCKIWSYQNKAPKVMQGYTADCLLSQFVVGVDVLNILPRKRQSPKPNAQT